MSILTPKEIELLKERVNSKRGQYQYSSDIIRENIFTILQNESRMIQYPIPDDELCAFVCKKQGILFSFINSYIPKDKQIFAAAHELYHIWYEPERLDKVELLKRETLDNETTNKSELMANRFAAMFLVPKESLLKQLDKLGVDSTAKEITIKEIVRLIPIFQVPYKTIVRRLEEIKMISESQCNDFLSISDRTETDGVLLEMKKLQLPLDSQKRSENIVVDNLIQKFITTYDSGLISSNQFTQYLGYVKKTPVELGYPAITEEDYALFFSEDDDYDE